MKITKFTHSCILAETPDRVALFDPGGYSWDALGGSLDPIDRVDRLVVSHKHEDHLNIEFVSALLEKFPAMHIVCNDEVEQTLREAGVDTVFRGTSTACTRGFDAPHGHLNSVKDIKPKNTAYHFQEKLTHPGDSLSLSQTAPILAVPFVSIWGSVDEAVKMVIDLKPEVVIPIHDWHFSEEAREHLYEKLQRLLPEITQFAYLEHGDSIDL